MHVATEFSSQQLKPELEITSDIQACSEEKPLWLSNFINTYEALGVDNFEPLAELYHSDVVFQDPMHVIEGLENLYNYFVGLYENISYCQFTINEVYFKGNSAAVYWQMKFQHPRLSKGEIIEVEGHTSLKGLDDKVTYHRDYLDIGQMLYEHIPVLGRVILWLKARTKS